MIDPFVPGQVRNGYSVDDPFEDTESFRHLTNKLRHFLLQRRRSVRAL